MKILDAKTALYTRLTIDSRLKWLCIYLEWQREGGPWRPKFTTEMIGKDCVNSVVGKFEVNKLPFGWRDRVRRFFGGNVVVYVRNVRAEELDEKPI